LETLILTLLLLCDGLNLLVTVIINVSAQIFSSKVHTIKIDEIFVNCK